MARHTLLAAGEGYNLSQQTGKWPIPTKLLELSMQSMASLSQEAVMAVPEPEEPSYTVREPDGDQELLLQGILDIKLIPIGPLKTETTVVGVDASCIKLGETSSGLIVALRGAVVWRMSSSCRYIRVGPLIFHITDENKGLIYGTLRRLCLGLPERQEAPSLPYLPVRMANIFEQWIREMACRCFTDSIMLFDGSLTVGPDGLGRSLETILELARANSDIVIAISKNSNLRLMGRKLMDWLNGFNGPYLLEIGAGALPRAPNIRLLGRIYVAKLARTGYAFRLDVDAGVPRETGIDAIRALLANDAIYQGYPEVLRLAHIMCTFTAPEVMAMQLMLSRTYGLRMIQRPDLRRLLFGPFGTGGRLA